MVTKRAIGVVVIGFDTEFEVDDNASDKELDAAALTTARQWVRENIQCAERDVADADVEVDFIEDPI